MSKNLLHKTCYYLWWTYQCKFHKRKIPLTSSLILTDKCNLKCQHCTVANLGYAESSYKDVIKDIRTLYNMGSRMLVITGGEPFLWEDGEYRLNNVVREAKRLGFFRIVVCTNGTFELKSDADYLWVSLDGFPKEHNTIRGDVYGDVIHNISQSNHEGIYINFTISKVNLMDLEDSADVVLNCRDIRGVLFHLCTPYIGSDETIMLDEEERNIAINKLQRIKKRHPTKVSNTFDGINLLKSNRWERPIWASIVINQGKISPCCCRKGIYDSDVCLKCGCSPAVETLVLQRLKPLAIIENLRFL
ncbi:radical SAM protein [Candidatus Omnitrophota bacterium]